MQKRKRKKEIKTTVNQRPHHKYKWYSAPLRMCEWVSESVSLWESKKKKWLRCGEVICSSCTANLCVSIHKIPKHTLQSKRIHTHTHTGTAKQDNIGYSHVLAMFDGFGEINAKNSKKYMSEPKFMCTLKESKRGVWKKEQKSQKVRTSEREKIKLESILLIFYHFYVDPKQREIRRGYCLSQQCVCVP